MQESESVGAEHEIIRQTDQRRIFRAHKFIRMPCVAKTFKFKQDFHLCRESVSSNLTSLLNRKTVSSLLFIHK